MRTLIGWTKVDMGQRPASADSTRAAASANRVSPGCRRAPSLKASRASRRRPRAASVAAGAEARVRHARIDRQTPPGTGPAIRSQLAAARLSASAEPQARIHVVRLRLDGGRQVLGRPRGMRPARRQQHAEAVVGLRRSRAIGAALPRTARRRRPCRPRATAPSRACAGATALSGASSTRLAKVVRGRREVAAVERADARALSSATAPSQQSAQLHHQRIRRADLDAASLAQVRFRLARYRPGRDRPARAGSAPPRPADRRPAPARGSRPRARSRAAPAPPGRGRTAPRPSAAESTARCVNSGSASSGSPWSRCRLPSHTSVARSSGCSCERALETTATALAGSRVGHVARARGSTASARRPAPAPVRGAGTARPPRSSRRPSAAGPPRRRPERGRRPVSAGCRASVASAAARRSAAEPPGPCCERSGSDDRRAGWPWSRRGVRGAAPSRPRPADAAGHAKHDESASGPRAMPRAHHLPLALRVKRRVSIDLDGRAPLLGRSARPGDSDRTGSQPLPGRRARADRWPTRSCRPLAPAATARAVRRRPRPGPRACRAAAGRPASPTQ